MIPVALSERGGWLVRVRGKAGGDPAHSTDGDPICAIKRGQGITMAFTPHCTSPSPPPQRGSSRMIFPPQLALSLLHWLLGYPTPWVHDTPPGSLIVAGRPLHTGVLLSGLEIYQ